MSGFTHLLVQQDKNKDMVYIPMCGSAIINVMVYTLFGGSPKLKVKPFTLVIYWIVKCITQDIKNNFENMSV